LREDALAVGFETAFFAATFFTSVFPDVVFLVFDATVVVLGFLVVAVVAFLVVVVAVFFVGAAFLVAAAAAGLVAFLAAGAAFFTAAAGLEAVLLVFGLAGFAFSFAESVLTLGASLTLPDGPLGRKKEPASAPCEMARLSRERAALFISILYFVSANFLMVLRETPARAS